MIRYQDYLEKQLSKFCNHLFNIVIWTGDGFARWICANKNVENRATMAGNAIPVTGCGKYDLVVLDEVIRLIQDKPEKIELILTGRYADARLGSFAGLD